MSQWIRDSQSQWENCQQLWKIGRQTPTSSGKVSSNFVSERHLIVGFDFSEIKKENEVIVTKYSMDHYLAQQFNLDLDKMPANVPEKF